MAEQRYNYTDTELDRYKTTRYPVISPMQGDYYIISRSGDRLDLLAQQFYGDVREWWIIADANNIGKGSLNIEPGHQIRIPDPRLNFEELLQNAAN
jgi:hypothetical protein